jgi:hypothetical protein
VGGGACPDGGAAVSVRCVRLTGTAAILVIAEGAVGGVKEATGVVVAVTGGDAFRVVVSVTPLRGVAAAGGEGAGFGATAATFVASAGLSATTAICFVGAAFVVAAAAAATFLTGAWDDVVAIRFAG